MGCSAHAASCRRSRHACCIPLNRRPHQVPAWPAHRKPALAPPHRERWPSQSRGSRCRSPHRRRLPVHFCSGWLDTAPGEPERCTRPAIRLGRRRQSAILPSASVRTYAEAVAGLCCPGSTGAAGVTRSPTEPRSPIRSAGACTQLARMVKPAGVGGSPAGSQPSATPGSAGPLTDVIAQSPHRPPWALRSAAPGNRQTGAAAWFDCPAMHRPRCGAR